MVSELAYLWVDICMLLRRAVNHAHLAIWVPRVFRTLLDHASVVSGSCRNFRGFHLSLLLLVQRENAPTIVRNDNTAFGKCLAE